MFYIICILIYDSDIVRIDLKIEKEEGLNSIK